MVRWKPEARDRLQAAAFELFAEQGFEATTVTQIAAAVGLSERTFFRHFADKREVLFAGQGDVAEAFVAGAATAPADAPPMDVVAAAIAAGSGFFTEDRRPFARIRHLFVAANPELVERELLKMTSLARVLESTLRERGIPETAATLAAESGTLVFRVAFDRWIRSGTERQLAEVTRDVFVELSVVAGGLTAE